MQGGNIFGHQKAARGGAGGFSDGQRVGLVAVDEFLPHGSTTSIERGTFDPSATWLYWQVMSAGVPSSTSRATHVTHVHSGGVRLVCATASTPLTLHEVAL